LSPQQPTLEATFLDLTRDAVDFRVDPEVQP
jgi:hypothetical protein